MCRLRTAGISARCQTQELALWCAALDTGRPVVTSGAGWRGRRRAAGCVVWRLLARAALRRRQHRTAAAAEDKPAEGAAGPRQLIIRARLPADYIRP